jgi:hypothetical protein
MPHPVTSRGKAPPGEEAQQAPEQQSKTTGGEPVRFETHFTEAGGAAVAALLHLMHLMANDLVLMRGDGDTGWLEEAVRRKIEQFPGPTANPQARAAGLAHARHLVEQVLLQIRAQAELRKSLRAAPPSAPASSDAAPPEAPPRLLN